LALQFWSHHSAAFASFLRTSLISGRDCFLLLLISGLPLLVLELRKVLRAARVKHRDPSVARNTSPNGQVSLNKSQATRIAARTTAYD
jgi:hypothetical protein